MSQIIAQIEDITLDGFQVVSKSMFSHYLRTSDPTCTVWEDSISFSKATILALNSCDRIVIRVNSKTKCLLIAPAPANDKDAVTWKKGSGEVQSKRIECKQFGDQLYKSWGLDTGYVYRACGKLVSVEKKIMLLFDFNTAEKWLFKSKDKGSSHE